MRQKLHGGIELGGTKTICAIGDVSGTITAQLTIPTTDTNETLTAIFKFFEQNGPIDSLGIGSFGPLNLDTASAEFGYIYNAPKPGWSKVNVKGLLEERLKIPISIDTDVNCAALGEHYYGNAKGVNNLIYLTIGTGIGGSLIIDGKIIRGILNLEMGHTRIPHEPFDGPFKGSCPFHSDCLEGIASGYAMEQRYGKRCEQITDTEAWDLEAGYIASAVGNLMLGIGPEMIVVGGGLTKHRGLIEAIRVAISQNINGYMEFPDLTTYIISSSGASNGVLGAIRLAALAN